MRNSVDTVMLVDDNDTDNFIHKRVIELTGFAKNIIVKNSGKSALEYLSGNKNNLQTLPDVIFLDINMPGTTSLYLVETLKDNPDWHDIPVMMLSSMSYQQIQEVFKKKEVTDFFCKLSLVQEQEKQHLLRVVSEYIPSAQLATA